MTKPPDFGTQKSGDQLRVFVGHNDHVYSFAFSPDGTEGRQATPAPPQCRTDGMKRGQFRTHLKYNIKERRCVIPAQGFYEWREEGGKQPYFERLSLPESNGHACQAMRKSG